MDKTALFSAYRKTDALARFARQLKERGWNILASAGTKAFFDKEGIAAADVASIAGPPILGHRVVTLSREICAALLARKEDETELDRLGLRRIDLVFIDLYPLEEEIARSGATESSVLEKTDIGGPTLLRAAAKGRRIVLSDASQFDEALRYLDAGREDGAYLASLAAGAEERAARYSGASAAFARAASRGL